MERVINGVKIGDETEFVFTANPKRPGFKAHARYTVYGEAKNLKEYLDSFDGQEGMEKKYALADLRYDVEHGHLKLLEDGEELTSSE